MEITPVEIWLALGIICILAELAAIPGIGLLFIGLGALSTSILIYYIQVWLRIKWPLWVLHLLRGF